MVPIAPSRTRSLSRSSASSCAAWDGTFKGVSLAGFVTRPQAEHQIGAVRGILPMAGVTVNRTYNGLNESVPRRVSLYRRRVFLPGALGRLRSGRHHLLSDVFPL